MSKEKECGAQALYRYTWPGNDEAYACQEHANQLNHVANAIGMHLQFINIIPNEKLTCSTKVKED